MNPSYLTFVLYLAVALLAVFNALLIDLLEHSTIEPEPFWLASGALWLYLLLFYIPRKHNEIRVARVRRMFAKSRSLMKIENAIWSGFRFDTGNPAYDPELLPIAFGLYDRHREAGDEAVSHCMLLLGRVFNAKKDYLPACRFFLRAARLYPSDFVIIAVEFLREELRAPGAKAQIGLDRGEFEEKYENDTPDSLVAEYRGNIPELESAYKGGKFGPSQL